MRHNIARSAVRDRRYRKRCWRAAVVVAILAVAGTVNSADAPPLLSPEQMNGSEIQLALQKLNVLGRVLYVAAHPDDENTKLMALWANGSLYDAAYLSVTRGDGGQNLIGPELREKLGVIRTEELLAARRIDHAPSIFHARDRFRVFQDRGRNVAHLGSRQDSCGHRLGDSEFSSGRNCDALQPGG